MRGVVTVSLLHSILQKNLIFHEVQEIRINYKATEFREGNFARQLRAGFSLIALSESQSGSDFLSFLRNLRNTFSSR